MKFQKGAVSQSSKKADKLGIGSSVDKGRTVNAINALATVNAFKQAAAVAHAESTKSNCREVWTSEIGTDGHNGTEDVARQGSKEKDDALTSFRSQASVIQGFDDASGSARAWKSMKSRQMKSEREREELVDLNSSSDSRKRYEGKLNHVMGVIICFNAVAMALELDYGPDAEAPLDERLPWVILESLFLVAFIIEGCTRIYWERMEWLMSAWNYLDALVIALGIVDCWVLTMIEAEDSGLRMVTLIRLARLVRLLRVAKLVRAFRTFYVTVMAFRDAFLSMLNILALMTAGLFLCAIFTTSTIGKSDDLKKLQMGNADGNERFGSIPKSMYSLFELMTLEGWEQVGRPLVKAEPAMGVFLFLFIMVFTFGLLNMIVAMVVEKTLLHQRKMDEHVQEVTQDELEQELVKMKESFVQADTDNVGHLTYDKFESNMNEEESLLAACLRRADVPTDDPATLFSILDQDIDGHLSYEELLVGCARIHGGSFDVLAIQAAVRSVQRQVRKLRHEIRPHSDHWRPRRNSLRNTAMGAARDNSLSSMGSQPHPPPAVMDVMPPVSHVPELTVVSSFDSPEKSRQIDMPGVVNEPSNDAAVAPSKAEELEKRDDTSNSGVSDTEGAAAARQMDLLRRLEADAAERKAQQDLLQKMLAAQSQILQRIDSVDGKQDEINRRVASVEATLANWAEVGVS